MFIPKLFQNLNREEVLAFMRQHAFATVVGQVAGAPWGVHIPLHLQSQDADTLLLQGHVAKANAIAQCMDGAQPLLAIFQGPHGYVSPTWYNHVNVPTWNYIAVHATGMARALTEAETVASLQTLMHSYEGDAGIQFSHYTPDFVAAHVRALVAFELRVEKLEAQYKLSQNRDTESHGSVVAHLAASPDAAARATAKAMQGVKKS